MDRIINGVIINETKKIRAEKGDIWHVLKKSDKGFSGFGEVYFSNINFNEIKGWNLHKRMTLNLIVPLGEVLFVLYDPRLDSTSKGIYNTFTISSEKYNRITIPPKIYLGFKGLSKPSSLVLNVASIEHDKNEIEKLELSSLEYDWT